MYDMCRYAYILLQVLLEYDTADEHVTAHSKPDNRSPVGLGRAPPSRQRIAQDMRVVRVAIGAGLKLEEKKH